MMSNNNTTDTQNSKNKQVWLDTLVSLPSETTPQQTPKVAAQEYIQAHVELLHNDIATILKKIGYIHTNLLHKLRNKIAQKERMKLDNELFPRSTRLAFTLRTSKKAEELSDYLELQEETDVYIDTVKQ